MFLPIAVLTSGANLNNHQAQKGRYRANFREPPTFSLALIMPASATTASRPCRPDQSASSDRSWSRRCASAASGECALSCPIFSKFCKLTGIPQWNYLRLAGQHGDEAVGADQCLVEAPACCEIGVARRQRSDAVQVVGQNHQRVHMERMRCTHFAKRHSQYFSGIRTREHRTSLLRHPGEERTMPIRLTPKTPIWGGDGRKTLQKAPLARER